MFTTLQKMICWEENTKGEKEILLYWLLFGSVTSYHHCIDLSPYICFLDALASLGSMLESESVINVFEILSNLGHIIKLPTGYVQNMFRVGSE